MEGLYLKVIPHRTIAFTWGGIEGLKIGESTVEFRLQSDTTGTVRRFGHFNLSKPPCRSRCCSSDTNTIIRIICPKLAKRLRDTVKLSPKLWPENDRANRSLAGPEASLGKFG